MWILEKAEVGPTKDAYVVGVELDMSNLLVMGAKDSDCGLQSDFDLRIKGGDHCVCMMVG